MIKSMTGFGAGSAENNDFKIQIELKTVNQRFLETNFHMPYSLGSFETNMVRKIKDYVARGKMDINVKFQDLRPQESQLSVNLPLVEAYGQALRDIETKLHLTDTITAAQIAAYPDVILTDTVEQSLEEAEPVALAALEAALRRLVAMREEEGQNMEQDLLQRIGILEDYVEQLAILAPEIVASYKGRLEKLLGEYLQREAIEETRIIQETALYTDKVNYTEEIVRLRSHFAQFRSILQAEEPVGRKLDFLIQEMNREINTVASKANAVGAAQVVVEVKNEIEKIREQIQNIE